MHRIVCALLFTMLVGIFASCSGSDGPEIIQQESTSTPVADVVTATPIETEEQGEQFEPSTATEMSASPTAMSPKPTTIAAATLTATSTVAKATPTTKPTATYPLVPTAADRAPVDLGDSAPNEIDPVAIVIRALVDIRGREYQPGNPWDTRLVDQAFLIFGAYHLFTVPVGQYNADNSGFYAWAKQFLAYCMNRPDVDRAQFHGFRDHLHQQVYVTLTQPQSEIGELFRSSEQIINAVDPKKVGNQYWANLIAPASLILGAQFTPLAEANLTRQYNQLVLSYRAARISNPNLGYFADFVAHKGFAEDYFKPRAAESSPSPTASVDNLAPSITQIIYDRPLSEWRELQYDYGWMEPTADSLLAGIYAYASQGVIEAWTNRSDFGDISASVQVRQVSGDDDSEGCLAIRHDVASGDYSFCILGNGETRVTYSYVDGNGNWQDEILLAPKPRPNTRPEELWNTLEIRARGNQFWMLINGTVVGSGTHNGRASGDVAIIVTNRDSDQFAEFEFRELVVRELE